jgi:hypothetical protein
MNNNDLINVIMSTDWEFSDSDTQYLTHNIHRYSGKFIPQIAAKVIELLTKPQDLVLDSYMGSGTTLLESLLSNRNSIGIDLNPLAVLISKVKTTPIMESEITEIRSVLVPFVRSLLSEGQINLFDEPLDTTSYKVQFETNKWRLEDAWYQKWYQPNVLYQLVQIFSCIETINSEKAKNIALVAFSDILRKSSNASSKYPNVMFDKNVNSKPLPARSFLESLINVVDSVNSMSVLMKDRKVKAEVLLHNNLNLALENASIDAIISHPPYIAAIPYAEYGSLSLNWLGYDSKKLDKELTGGKRSSSKVVSKFCTDYEQYFKESYRVLKPEHYMFLMVGNPVSHGKKIELNTLTIEYGTKAGFKHVATAIRQGQNRRGNNMAEEYLIFFQK